MKCKFWNNASCQSWRTCRLEDTPALCPTFHTLVKGASQDKAARETDPNLSILADRIIKESQEANRINKENT